MSENALYANGKLATYFQGNQPVPEKCLLWPLYGAGLENLGKDGAPILVDTPSYGPDQLLVRHDAVGLCFSDTKVIKAGESHPRLTGRDMKANPVVLGHEVVLTVMAVGEDLKGQYKQGDRFLVQADIYYKGVGMAYGYALQGGLSQYNVIGQEILDGDDGCYLIPVKETTGYAQAALTEPWACVVASYDVEYRVGWKAGGTVLLVTGPNALADYEMGTPYAGGQAPAQVIALGVQGSLAKELAKRAASEGFALVTLGAPSVETLEEAKAASSSGGFDDIVFLGTDEPTYELVEPAANQGCQLNIVGAQGFSGKTQVDVGRLHYDNLSLTGTNDTNISMSYAPIRTHLSSGGRSLFIGAAGPMGQMHVQRALQLDGGPSLVVATDLVAERLAVIEDKYGQLIEDKAGKVKVVLRTPEEGQSGQQFNAGLGDLVEGQGYTDVVVLAPSAGVVAGAADLLAPNALMNVFAGLARGTRAPINLAMVADQGVRFTGTSGSAIRDMRNMLDAAEGGQLNPNLSVAAISGMRDVKKGLDGVIHQAFPGKCVIYPQIEDFPLTRLSELQDVLPSVYAKLGRNLSWTVEAEAEFLKELLP